MVFQWEAYGTGRGILLTSGSMTVNFPNCHAYFHRRSPKIPSHATKHEAGAGGVNALTQCPFPISDRSDPTLQSHLCHWATADIVMLRLSRVQATNSEEGFGLEQWLPQPQVVVSFRKPWPAP